MSGNKNFQGRRHKRSTIEKMRASKLGHVVSEETRKKISKTREKYVGENATAWKGGRRIAYNGYAMVRVGRTYIREHHVIMEKQIGRKIGFNEVVHHVNGIKTDNRIENLVLLLKADHSKLHDRERKRNEKGQFKK